MTFFLYTVDKQIGITKVYRRDAFLFFIVVSQPGDFSMNKIDAFVSLRRDMGHVLWSGLQLQPEVDIRFTMERIRTIDGLRVIRAIMSRPGVVTNLDSRRDFDLSALGNDYDNLETPEAEMMVASNHVTDIRASVKDTGIELVLQLPEQPQVFWLAAGIEGRWDWFVNPRELPDVAAALSASRRVSDFQRQAA